MIFAGVERPNKENTVSPIPTMRELNAKHLLALLLALAVVAQPASASEPAGTKARTLYSKIHLHFGEEVVFVAAGILRTGVGRAHLDDLTPYAR